ncbi:MAG: hypothetical protein JWP59_2266, partial [Massilia sp.]|nr:hypothetical protein [Massilia sp.]
MVWPTTEYSAYESAGVNSGFVNGNDEWEATIHLLPCSRQEDFEYRSIAKRVDALGRLLNARQAAPGWRELASLWHEMPANARILVASHPTFFVWAREYAGQRTKQGDRKGLRLCERLATLICGAALSEGLDIVEPIHLASESTNRLTIIGSNTYICAADSSRPLQIVTLTHQNGNVRIRREDCGEQGGFPLSILGSAVSCIELGGGFRALRADVMQGGIEVVSAHTMVQAFFDGLPTGPEIGVSPRLYPVIPAETRSRVEEALQIIEDAWPEMRAELGRHLHMIVPFQGSARVSFTNPTWQGALFFRDPPADIWALVEAFVHEASHLQLNVFLSVARLHEWGAERTAQSPFREGPRPLDALFHGVFVFARIILMRARC